MKVRLELGRSQHPKMAAEQTEMPLECVTADDDCRMRRGRRQRFIRQHAVIHENDCPLTKRDTLPQRQQPGGVEEVHRQAATRSFRVHDERPANPDCHAVAPTATGRLSVATAARIDRARSASASRTYE